jgi:phage shock protein PspC (stress-responsive transcriptional regulator)
MKKVITIHINGILYNMEEDAFATMRESLFRQGKQGDKITESLIAEKFSMLLSESKHVITLADVQSVLPQLGIMVSYESNSGIRNEVKQLHRKSSGKVVGGVCAGFAEYWNIDPVVLRILFVVLFFGFGIGLLFYLLLWIILPVK